MALNNAMPALNLQRVLARAPHGSRILDFFLKRPERHHWRRYLLGALVSNFAVWTTAVAYFVLTPATYTSTWSFILPGSGAGSSVSLESIGQASAQSASPFSTPAMSPKVIYKEIATSDRVLAAAADALHMTAKQFGAPRVKLVDETALMYFEISGRTPDIARAKANALNEAFMKQLDVLRKDEIDRRAESVSDSLKSYRETLQNARQKIYDTQQESGLVSVEQFNSLATGLEEVRRKTVEARAEVERLDAEQAALTDRLGVSPKAASTALILAADPVFTKALTEYGDSRAAYDAQQELIGPNNPVLVRERMRRDAAFDTIRNIARKAGIDVRNELPRLILILNSKGREELLKQLVMDESTVDGKRRELAALEQTFANDEQRVKELNGKAARLEDLRKDHILAEAVFTSAVARLDTSRADIYASYPLVQVLADPNLPSSRTQPLLIYAIGGGFVGSFFATVAWCLAWLRQLFVRKRRKSA
jgi:uncharacterized protein involved in exopolysaccharide biosynthesis